MANLNKVMLIGNLTRDPELRHTPKGSAVADLGLAVNRRTQDGNGVWREEATFVDVTVWGTTAENAHKYLSKGRGVFVEGRLQLDSWDDKATGQKRTKLKVVGETLQFLPDGKGRGETANGSKGNDGNANDSSSNGNADRPGASAAAAEDYDDEDDIPF